MPRELDRNRSASPSLVRRGIAALVLVAAALVVFHFIAGLVTIIAIIAAVGAILWAANQLL